MGDKKRDRKDPFYRLEEYASSPFLSCVNSKVSFPTYQMELFGGSSLQGLNTKQGDLFENYFHSVHGGELRRRLEIDREDGTSLESLIDLVDRRGNYREVKSIRTGARVRLMNRQVSRTAYTLATNHSLPHYSSADGPIVIYDIVLHGQKEIKKKFGESPDFTDMFVSMILNIRKVLSLDFSIVLQLWNPRTTKLQVVEGKDYGSKGYFGPVTFLRGGIIANLFVNPEETLVSHGIDPKNYSITRNRTPDNMTAGDHSLIPIIVPSVPSLSIVHKFPEEWLANHRKEDPKWFEDYFDVSQVEEIPKEASVEERAELGISLETEEIPEIVEQESDIPF